MHPHVQLTQHLHRGNVQTLQLWRASLNLAMI